jgi:hypothetical protein
VRIISKFHDYYDGVAKSYYDPHIKYIRTFKKINIDKVNNFRIIKNLQEKMPRNFGQERVTESCLFIGFCGVIYPCYYIQVHKNFENSKYYFCYTVEQVNRTLFTGLKKKELEKYIRKYRYGKSTFRWIRPTTEKNIREVLKPINWDPIFFELNAPIFFALHAEPNKYKANYIYLNPELRRFDFQKFMEPHTAYQEISMYLGGILCSRENHPQVTDDRVLRDSKGFNNMSFKTYSPGHKPRGKRKCKS